MTARDVHEVLDALRSTGISAVAGGGWGIDALVARETRSHRDLDLAVPAEQLDDAIGALREIGYRVAVDQRPARVELRAGTRSVDFHPVVWDAAGNGLQQGLEGQAFAYPAASVRWMGSIADRRVRCISPALQALFHTGYALADEDRADMAALRAAVGDEVDAPATGTPGVVTPRLLLRGWRDADREPYAAICADEETMRYVRGRPLSREESDAHVDHFIAHWRRHGFGIWAVEDRQSRRFIGRIGLAVHDDWTIARGDVEVGWVLETAFRRGGLGTEGARAAIDYAFEVAGVPRVISIARPQNTASHRVMEKCGLTFRGRTVWRRNQVVWYAVERRNASDWSTG